MAKLRKLSTNFTIVSNEWLKDKNLSLKAKGLLCVLQGLPDEWDFSVSGLVAILKESRDCVQATIYECRDAGYLTWQKVRNEKGQFDVIVELHEKQLPVVSNHDGKSTVDKNTQYNKEIKKTNNDNTNVLSLDKSSEKPIKQQDQQSENTSSRFSLIGAECNNKIKTLTNKRSINDNTNVLSLDTSVETVKSNNETSIQKTTYGSERINQAFTWWQEAFGYELKPSQANRRAVWNMLRAKNKGEQWVKQMLALLVEAKKDKYSGIRIANYVDLQRDWEKLMAWGSSRYEQRTSNEDEFDRLVSQL